MRESVRAALIRLLRIPPEPKPPAGSPASLVVFRPSRKLFRLRLGLWGLKQIAAVAGFLIFLSLFGFFGEEVVFSQLEEAGRRAAGSDEETQQQVRKLQEIFREVRSYIGLVEIIEWVAIGYFVVQLPISYAWLHLEYEMRSYMATDRSLRLREGVWTVREMTLTYSNVQNVTIEQGPLQRLLGIADVVVQTAGGGSSKKDSGDKSKKRSMHEGRMRDVEQPEHIRERILDHLRQLGDAGLGDVEEHARPSRQGTSALDAAREVLTEARALRATLLG